MTDEELEHKNYWYMNRIMFQIAEGYSYLHNKNGVLAESCLWCAKQLHSDWKKSGLLVPGTILANARKTVDSIFDFDNTLKHAIKQGIIEVPSRS